MNDTDRAALAQTVARAQGCTCSPDVTVRRDPRAPLVRHLVVAHDDHCRLLARRDRRN